MSVRNPMIRAGNSHARTEGRKDQLIKGNALEHRNTGVHFGKRECSRQEAEPLELDWCHEETICHEPRDTLKVERRRGVCPSPNLSNNGRPPLIQIMNLYRDEVVILMGTLSISSPKGGNQLRNGIGDTTKHLYEPFIVNQRIQSIGYRGYLGSRAGLQRW